MHSHSATISQRLLWYAGVMSEWTLTFPLGWGLTGLWLGIVIGVTATGGKPTFTDCNKISADERHR